LPDVALLGGRSGGSGRCTRRVFGSKGEGWDITNNNRGCSVETLYPVAARSMML
jgi:hypothetical protein